MNYLSVCSGIEAASVAWHHMGWKPTAFSEIEPFPCAVLAHHYPTTPNWGDMTKYKEWPDADVNVLVGGTPCQSFSVAGLRKGLDDPRGNLMLTYLAIADRYRPKWLVWENVPGVLSSNGGLDFASLLRGMGELGYGFAYRVLDAQYLGVAQRRRRVFVVGCLGSWQRAAAVLFERHSLSGHPAPSRQAGKAAPIIPSRSTAGGGLGTDFDCDGGVITARMVSLGEYVDDDIASTMKMRDYKDATDLVAQPIAFDTTQLTSPSNYSSPQLGDPCHPLSAGAHPPAVAIGLDEEQNARIDGFGTLKARMEGGGFEGSVMTPAMQVRRLTPMECERLQGFPDGYTNIPWRGKLADQCPDGPRYKALGNSMAVPVMRWIGERIQAVEAIS